ncbi:hypothetical protein DZA35_00005, partial [Arcobacter sp. HD9-500m-PIT-SAG03]
MIGIFIKNVSIRKDFIREARESCLLSIEIDFFAFFSIGSEGLLLPFFASVGIYVIFLPKVLLDLGYSTSDIGIVLALAPLMRFVTPFLFLKHVKLDRKVFTLALIGAVCSALLFYSTIENFYLFIINNGILGICLSLLLPYIETIALKELGKQRYGKSRLYGSIGFMMVALILAKFLDSPQVALHYYL